MKFNHRYKPKTEAENIQLKAIEVASEILEEQLDLKDRGLILMAQRQTGWAGADAYHAGRYQEEEIEKFVFGKPAGTEIERTIKINFRNLEGSTLASILEVLGHEFRHAVQYHMGWLGFDNRKWSGASYSKNMNCDEFSGKFRRYFNRPQEIDARLFQKTNAQLVINDPRFSDFVQYLDTSVGAPLMKEDREANYLATGFPKEQVQVMWLRETGRDVLYWFSLSQLNERLAKPVKKVTQKHINLMANADNVQFLKSQVFNKIFVPVTVEDLVS